MAFSISNSRSQESPVLWLSVVAGSLALHLVVLLVGRWYLSQPPSGRAGGGSQAPLDFVEIDPNAPPLKRSISPSATATEDATVPKAAPEAATPEQSQQPSIENLSRQTTPERSQPQPSPQSESSKPDVIKPTRPDLRSSTGNPQTSTTQPRTPAPTQPSPGSSTRPSTSPAPGTNPNPNSPGSSPSTGSNSSRPNSSGSSAPSSGTTGNPTSPTQPGGATAPTGGSAPIGSGNSLEGASIFQGEISRTLELDPYAGQQEGSVKVTLKDSTLPEISLAEPIKVPVKVLDLKVGLSIDPQGLVIGVEVRKESPTLQTYPQLKDTAQAIASQAFMNAGSLFDVQLETNTNPEQLSYRIASVQIRVAK